MRENVTGSASLVAALSPDFVLFQEVDIDGTRSHHIDERAYVVRAMDGREADEVFAQNYDSPYLLYPFTAPHGANQSGLVTLSRSPVTSALRRSLPIEGGFMKFLDLDRCYSVSRIPTANGKELVLYNLHLSAYTSDGMIATEQLALLCADMLSEYEAGNYCVAGGDFNKDLLGNSGDIFGVTTGEDESWAQPIPVGTIPDGLTLVVPFDEAAPVATCRTANEVYNEETSFRVTVDGFLISSNVEAVAANGTAASATPTTIPSTWISFCIERSNTLCALPFPSQRTIRSRRSAAPRRSTSMRTTTARSSGSFSCRRSSPGLTRPSRCSSATASIRSSATR